MTFIKVATSPEELYDVMEDFEAVVSDLRTASQSGAAFVTFTTDNVGLEEQVCLNASHIEAVWPS